MPRSGNTLFASLMNQNPELVVTPNSITLEIMKELYLLKGIDVVKNFPDEQSLDNVMDEVYNLYYKKYTVILCSKAESGKTQNYLCGTHRNSSIQNGK